MHTSLSIKGKDVTKVSWGKKRIKSISSKKYDIIFIFNVYFHIERKFAWLWLIYLHIIDVSYACIGGVLTFESATEVWISDEQFPLKGCISSPRWHQFPVSPQWSKDPNYHCKCVWHYQLQKKRNWNYVKLELVRTLLRITRLVHRKSYLIIILPNSHENFTKNEISSSWSRFEHYSESLL